MAVTIKDVAKAAGVSHTTVSRALRDNPAISLETTNQIKVLAREMGYVPNTVARGLKTKRSAILGVIVRRVDDLYFGLVLNGIEDVLQAAGYSLFLAVTHHNEEKERQIIEAMAERRVDGVIFCSTRTNEEGRETLAQFGIPSVSINNQVGDVSSAHAVMHDDKYGCNVVTNHLIELGHKHIGYVGNANAGKTNRNRQLGYQQALTDAGLILRPGSIVMSPNGLPDGGHDVVGMILDMDERPTAVVCFNDMLAIGVMRGLEDAGIRIPDDCSVTGFDNTTLAQYMKPSLTTFNQPKYELGAEAAQRVLQLLETEDRASLEMVQLRGELVVRDSTAPLLKT